jgi:hypothetical protein
MILNEQLRQIGRDNFSDALQMTRRQLLPALVTLPSVTAFYWGYQGMKGNPVRAALIGAGGQGRSHIDSLNPEYIKLVAFSDIRPSIQKKARISLEAKYGSEARNIELIEDYHKLLDRDDIEMVIIALPSENMVPAASGAFAEYVTSRDCAPGTNSSLAPRPGGGPGLIRSRGICTWLVVSAVGLK